MAAIMVPAVASLAENAYALLSQLLQPVAQAVCSSVSAPGSGHLGCLCRQHLCQALSGGAKGCPEVYKLQIKAEMQPVWLQSSQQSSTQIAACMCLWQTPCDAAGTALDHLYWSLLNGTCLMAE